MPKRVWTLYRVSTKNQLTKDEIPNQQRACKEYIKQKENWVLTREVSEKGVSAFKNKAADREVLNEILQGAINKEFDILLIYKADRLGRLFMDTPLYLYELYQHGVETYSTVEDYLDVSTHNARLLVGFIFWQSEGESQSTSQRVRDFMNQYNQQGLFMGGTPPYGYKVLKTGRPHWKHKDKIESKLVIDEAEAQIVKLIFELAYEKNFGATKIANHLNANGYKTRVGGFWRSNVINRILKNTVYIGLKRFDVYDKNRREKPVSELKLQPRNLELAIIDEKIFYAVQEGIKNRTAKKVGNYKNSFPTHSKMLLAGIAKCGYCGGKLKADYSVKTYKRKTDGKVTRMVTNRYTCMNARENKEGHPIRYFSAKMFEKEVLEQVFYEIERMDLSSVRAEKESAQTEKLKVVEIQIREVKDEIKKTQKELDALKSEVTKVILGESKFDSKMLQDLIDEKHKSLEELLEKEEELVAQQKTVMKDSRSENEILDIFKEFKDKFEGADIYAKKTMLANIIEELYLYKGGGIKIKFNL